MATQKMQVLSKRQGTLLQRIRVCMIPCVIGKIGIRNFQMALTNANYQRKRELIATNEFRQERFFPPENFQ